MKAEIQKIMTLNKAGTLSDEQAAELLAALADDRRTEPADDKSRDTEQPEPDSARGGYRRCRCC